MSRQDADMTRHDETGSRQTPAAPDTPLNEPNINNYSYSVAQTVEAFAREGFSVSERTVQRYCDKQKLGSVRINPDTRQLTTDSFYVYMIDPSTIPDRIAQIREKQEFSNLSVTATVPDMSRDDATRPDVVVSENESRHENSEESKESATTNDKSVSELEAENDRLKIELEVSKRLYDAIAKDRQSLLEVSERLGREIGETSARLKQVEELNTKLLSGGDNNYVS